VLQGYFAGFAAGVEDGGGIGAVGAEGHAVVVEFCAGMEFVDAGLEGGLPYFEAEFGWQKGKFGEFGGCALQGFLEGFEDGGGGFREGSWDGTDGEVGAAAGF